METPGQREVSQDTPPSSLTRNIKFAEKTKRQPRNSACQACASLKMKCIANAEGGKCERCLRVGKECVLPIPGPRKRKIDSNTFETPGGIPLSDFLNSNASSAAPDRSISHSITQTRPPVEDSSSIDTLTTSPDIRHNGSKSFARLFAHRLCLNDLPPGVGIDYNSVKNSLAMFRQFAAHFPFVSNFLGADSVAMISQLPFTTAAVCTVTASTNPTVQEHLSEMFRFAFSTKVLVEGGRSLDLMIGLLVYLAWHHHYMSKPQVYQNLCLLAGMAVDLDLYQQSPHSTLEDAGIALERDRAFLGCYYICSSLSKGLMKPNPLRWTDHLRRCGENITKSGSMASDQNLISMIELAHILEDLEEGIGSGVDLKRSTVSYSIEMHAKAAHQRLKTLKREHPAIVSHPVFSAAIIETQYKLLAANNVPDTSVLIQCACAIKEYLDDVLSRPSVMLHEIAIVDWSNLLEVLVLLLKVSQSLPNNAGWESGALKTMLQPNNTLDALYAHMASVPPAEGSRHDPLLQAFRRFCDHIKRDILDGSDAVADLPLLYDTNAAHNGVGSDVFRDGVLYTFMRGG